MDVGIDQVNDELDITISGPWTIYSRNVRKCCIAFNILIYSLHCVSPDSVLILHTSCRKSILYFSLFVRSEVSKKT